MNQYRLITCYSDKLSFDGDNHTLFPDYKSYESVEDFIKNLIAGKEQNQYNF